MMTDKYLKVGQYIVKLEYVHGVLHNVSSDNSFHPSVIITYEGGASVGLDFKDVKESEQTFNKIAEMLEAH